MTGTAYRTPKMKNAAAQQNNYLGDKLQQKFRGRVSSAAGRAVYESQATKNAREKINPFETAQPKKMSSDTVNYKRADTYVNTPSRVNTARPGNINHFSSAAAAPAGLRTGQASRSRTADKSISADKVRAGQNTRSNVRRKMSAAQAAYNRELARQREEARIKAREKALKAEKKRLKAEAAAEKKLELKKERLNEKEVISKKISFSTLMLMTICTVMVMLIIFSFAQIYEHTRQISFLETEFTAVQKKETELKLDLEIRDDIRTIEKIATGTIGMVKGDLVQKKFVSLNDQEDRIEIIGDVTENTDAAVSSGSLSTLLSAISENFGRFMEYIK